MTVFPLSLCLCLGPSSQPGSFHQNRDEVLKWRGRTAAPLSSKLLITPLQKLQYPKSMGQPSGPDPPFRSVHPVAEASSIHIWHLILREAQFKSCIAKESYTNFVSINTWRCSDSVTSGPRSAVLSTRVPQALVVMICFKLRPLLFKLFFCASTSPLLI